MIKRLGMLSALMVLFSAYLVAGNEGEIKMSNEFWVILGCVVACGVSWLLWYIFSRDTDGWSD